MLLVAVILLLVQLLCGFVSVCVSQIMWKDNSDQ